jgi:WD40 repeat protein
MACDPALVGVVRMSSSYLAAVLIVSSFVLPARAQLLPSQAKGSARSQIVMLSVNGGCAAGIIVGYDEKAIYIATAAHIADLSRQPFPAVSVKFEGLSKSANAGNFWPQFEKRDKGDLAVVIVDRDASLNKFLNELDFAMLSPVPPGPADAPVVSTGCSGGAEWSSGSRETLLAPSDGYLRFQSDVGEGQSGGGLFNEAWELIGMPLDQGPNGIYARPLNSILDDIRKWKVPVLLTVRPMKGRARGADEIARQNAAIAKSRELVAASLASLSDDPERSILLAMQAISSTRSFDNTVQPEAEDQLHRALLSSRVSVTLSRHEKPVTSVAWSPDGTQLATASEDGTIRIADAKTSTETLVLRGHKGVIHSIAWRPDGKKMASGGEDGTTRVWSLPSGVQEKLLPKSAGEVRSVAWNRNGSRLAYGSNNLVVWESDTDKATVLESYDGNYVLCLAWSPDAKLLAAGVTDRYAHIIDVAANAKLRSLPSGDWVRSVAWSPDGKRIATEDFGEVAIWDAGVWKVSSRLTGTRGYINSMAWSADGRMLATGDDTPKVWDVEARRLLMSLAGHTSWITAVMWSPSGNELASGSNDSTARIWNTSVVKEVQAFQIQVSSATTGFVPLLAWCPAGNRLVSAAQNIKVWDLEDGKEPFAIDTGDDLNLGQYQHLSAIAWNPKQERLVGVVGPIPTVTEWDMTTGKSLAHTQNEVIQAASTVEWSPDGTRIATVGGTGEFYLRDANTLEVKKKIETPTQFFRAVEWSPDGKKLATGSADATVTEDGQSHTYHNPTTIWDATTGTKLLELPDHNVISLSWSPDGTRIATAQDRFIRIWDATSGKAVLQFIAHRDIVESLAWSLDGRFLASGGPDNVTKIWEAATGQELMSLSGQDATVMKVAWTSAGDRLASVGGDGIIQVYAMSISELMAIAKRRVTRRLTDDECKQYLHVDKCPEAGI